MNFHVLTLFPQMIEQGLSTSITGRALENKLISLEAINIRDYSENKHNQVDDYPYGGGAGMVMTGGPIYRAYEACKEKILNKKSVSNNENAFNNDKVSSRKKLRVIYLTPQGSVFNQKKAEELALEEDLVFLCGHYEGIDERVLEMIVTDYISIGDYVLTGGELPAMVMIDTISRLIPGVLSNTASAQLETFHDNLLEHPQYTRPETFMGKSVPEVLLSGHHANVDKWRREQSLIRTAKIRPDLLEKANLSKEDLEFLKTIKKQ